ncbi:unnamed protein product [Pipistrellus nathusii]|uniref:Uncharacterized protein n=1 Tax=Pipistrellus nathusii TaxID=59473 RepID=A0ABP0AJJ0_PIPNA
MAAARHSTLDFKLGAKGEDTRPPPARRPRRPGSRGRTMRPAGPCALAAGAGVGWPRSDRAPISPRSRPVPSAGLDGGRAGRLLPAKPPSRPG